MSAEGVWNVKSVKSKVCKKPIKRTWAAHNDAKYSLYAAVIRAYSAYVKYGGPRMVACAQ